MHDSRLVGCLQGTRDLVHNGERLRHSQGTLGEPLAERDAFHKFCGNELGAVGLADLVNREDVGMVQRRGGLGFLEESL